MSDTMLDRAENALIDMLATKTAAERAEHLASFTARVAAHRQADLTLNRVWKFDRR